MKNLLICVLLVLSACVGTTRGPRPQHDRVSALEMEHVGGASLYEVLNRVKPQWFSGPRAVRAVYMHNQFMGGLELLQLFDPRAVAEVRYLSDTDTLLRYGATHRGPSLLIVLRQDLRESGFLR